MSMSMSMLLNTTGGPFNTGAGGGTADYAFCLLFGVMGMLVTYPLLLGFGLALSPVFCINLIYYVLYIWSKKHATSQASLVRTCTVEQYIQFIRTKMLIKIEAFKRQITQTMRSKLMLLARLVLCYQQ